MAEERIGRYRIIKEIGCGGMGKVFQVYDPVLSCNVALKLLLKSNSEISQARFLQEAQSTAKLDHPNIIKLHEISKGKNDQIFYTMDFIDGNSLRQLIQSKKLKIRDAIKIMEKIARAIDYAHKKGIIHRDIKPSNIMIDKYGEPKLMDFGLAKELEGNATKFSKTGAVIGTVGYMPPEQVQGNVEPASDIYALGAVLYKLLTGKTPFDSKSSVAMIYRILEETPKKPRERNSKISKDLEAICLKAIAKDTNARYRTAADMADDLKKFIKGAPVSARKYILPIKLIKWLRQNKNLAIKYTYITVILVLSSMMSVFLFYPYNNTKRVLLLFSHEADLAWNIQIKKAIYNSFNKHFINANKHLNIKKHYMQTKKYSQEYQINQEVNKAVELIKDFRPDVVITVGDNASGKVIPHFFKTSIQFVFCGVNNPKKYNFPQKNVTGVVEKLLIKQTFKMLQHFLPLAKRYVLLIDESISSKIMMNNLNNKHEKYQKISYLKSKKFTQWKSFLKKHENSIDFILLPTYSNLKDDNGNAVKSNSVMTWILKNIKKPPIGILDFNIQDGALLGVVDTAEKQGKAVAKYALKILTESKKAGNLPITDIGKGELYINTTTAKRFNIKIPKWVYQFAKLVKQE